MVAGDNIMSKKLLNETTIRRFAALSGIRADVVSNFINEEWQQTGEEAVNEEEEAEMEEKEGADEMDAEMDMMDDDDLLGQAEHDDDACMTWSVPVWISGFCETSKSWVAEPTI